MSLISKFRQLYYKNKKAALIDLSTAFYTNFKLKNSNSCIKEEWNY